MHKLLMVLGLAVAVSGCATFESDSRYRNEGPGNDLYSVEMPEATKNLQNYFQELAKQADLQSPPPDAGYGPIVTSPSDWDILVRTGMNDIDLRCDNYLTWIDKKRAERGIVNETITAISALTAGILGIAAPETTAISYIALGLGFTGSVYNAYQNSILMGLESSTIKAVVHERSQRLRAKWSQVAFNNKPDTVYALRSYLRICTPQAITLDVNTYTRDGITGDNRGRLEKEIKWQAAAVRTGEEIKANDPVTPPPRPNVLMSPPAYGMLFEGWKPQKGELKDLLTAICFSETPSRLVFRPDGTPGPEMKSAVIIAESEFYYKSPLHQKPNGKIDKTEFDQMVAATKDCASINAQNYHEAMQYDLPLRVKGLIRKLNRIESLDGGPPKKCIAETETLAVSGTLRQRIKALRAALANSAAANKLTADKDLIGIEEQLTVALTVAIDELAGRKPVCNNQ
mgnify:CR=1 FL=1